MNAATYYKAIRPDGTDWFSGELRWLPEDGTIPEGGWLVEHPLPGPVGDGNAVGYLSVATVPTDCVGMGWPARLLRVEPVGDVWIARPGGLLNKRAAHAWRVVEELPAHEALGPQGPEVAALLERTRDLTPGDVTALKTARVDERAAVWAAARDAALEATWYFAREAARDAAWYAARESVREAVRYAARYDVWDDAWYAARAAVLAVLVRDHITPEQYDILTKSWRTVMGDPGGEAVIEARNDN